MFNRICTFSIKVDKHWMNKIMRKNSFEILADDIFHAYLNGFNTRMLLHEYGSYQQCPDELHVRVEAIESYFMTEVSCKKMLR